MGTQMIDTFLAGPNLMLAAAIFSLTAAFKIAFKGLSSHHIAQRLMPLSPWILGVIGSFAGLSSGKTWQEKLLLGIIIGSGVGHGFKVGKTSVLGKGVSKPLNSVPNPPTVEPGNEPDPKGV